MWVCGEWREIKLHDEPPWCTHIGQLAHPLLGQLLHRIPASDDIRGLPPIMPLLLSRPSFPTSRALKLITCGMAGG